MEVVAGTVTTAALVAASKYFLLSGWTSDNTSGGGGGAAYSYDDESESGDGSSDGSSNGSSNGDGGSNEAIEQAHKVSNNSIKFYQIPNPDLPSYASRKNTISTLFFGSCTISRSSSA